MMLIAARPGVAADRAGWRICRWPTSDLPDGLVTDCCSGTALMPRATSGNDLRVELQPAVRTVGAVGAVGAAGLLGMTACRRPFLRPCWHRLRSVAWAVQKSAGRGLYRYSGVLRRCTDLGKALFGARPGVAGAAVLFAGPGGGSFLFAARRCDFRGRPSLGALSGLPAGDRGLAAVGGKLLPGMGE